VGGEPKQQSGEIKKCTSECINNNLIRSASAAAPAHAWIPHAFPSMLPLGSQFLGFQVVGVHDLFMFKPCKNPNQGFVGY
jgi:hypothetical protein